jgi:dolichyl-diphosphooligosaccharide--protein glycosyltransferase
MFPLLIVWIFTEAVMIKNLKKSLTLSILAGIVMFLFSTAWNGWQYLFYIIFAFNVLYILWCKIKGRNILPLILILSIFISTTILLIVFCTGSLNLINVLQGPIELFRLSNSNNIWSPWPDVYTSVSELKKPSFTELVGGFGVLLLGGIFGFFWTGRFLSNENLKNRYLKKMNWDFYIFLVIWSIIGFFSLTKGVRFIILVIPPLIISTGILIGICVEYLNNLKNFPKFAIFRKYPNFLKFISLIFVLIVCLPTTFNACYNFHIRSIVNDDVASAADWINKETPNETVIILEWSYGHFFSARADRPVIFDGRMAYIETLPIREYDSAYLYNDKSPNPSRDYWISRAFSTTNENLSIGIFRMLASSGDMAYLTLDNYIQNTTKTVLILNDILSSDKTSAKKLLLFKYNLDESQTQNVLKFTHPEKPMHYVIITTSDMANLGKSTFNTGNWDFNQLKPGNYTYSVGIFNTSEDTMNTTNEVFINLKNEFVSWKNKTPYMVTIIDNGLIKKHNMDENSNFVVVILMDEKKAIVMDKKFEKSMFTKMVLERSGGKYFKPLFQNKEVVIWEPKI